MIARSDLSNMFLKNVTINSVNGTIPEALWALFQMTFAIITPALMIGCDHLPCSPRPIAVPPYE